MTAALALPIARAAPQPEVLRERVEVLEPRPGVREVLLVTPGRAKPVDLRHAIIVLGGRGGGFDVRSHDGLPQVRGGLPLVQRQRLANAIGGAVVELSPPTDRPVMDRAWRLSDEHATDVRAAVTWSRRQWPYVQTWVLGLASGALSAAVAASGIEELAGAVLLSCVDDEALEQPQKSERMRVLAVRSRSECWQSAAASVQARGRRTLVTVHDERQARHDAAHDGDGMQFGGKDRQVMDVVARWILTGSAPEEIR